MKNRIILLAVLSVIFFSACLSSSESSPPEVEPEDASGEVMANDLEPLPGDYENIIPQTNEAAIEPDPSSDDSENVTPDTEVPVEHSVEPLLFSWKKDQGSRVTDGSVPYIHKLENGGSRLYYCNSKGILSAVSANGLTFTKEQGVRVSPGDGFETVVCDPTIVYLPDGKIRMYYKGANSQAPGPGNSVHKIFSAVSSDGLVFKKEGVRIDSETNGDNGWASVPDAINLPDGRVRLYYVTASEIEHGIGSAISSDGLNFVKEPGLRIGNLVDPALVKIGNRYLLFAASIDERFGALPKGIYYQESSDGLNFGEPISVFQEDNVYDPSVLKVDNSSLRVFYGKVLPPKPPAVESHTGLILE